jgi:hypothetical protein
MQPSDRQPPGEAAEQYPGYDGIEETELAQRIGFSSLAFNKWFSPFSDEPSRTPHPYVREDDSLKP